jgi:hypothetical protein
MARYKSMKYLWPIFLLSILQLPVDGAEKPNVDWYVHTVISDGIPNRHNLVRRAIVTYSESDPRLEVEIIDWRSGMGARFCCSGKALISRVDKRSVQILQNLGVAKLDLFFGKTGS